LRWDNEACRRISEISGVGVLTVTVAVVGHAKDMLRRAEFKIRRPFMKCPPVLATEAERLEALSEYGLGSDRPLPSLDPVVQIAARMFNMPVAAVNMIGSDHVFFAASIGLEGAGVNMSRDVSFCAHAIIQDEVMVVGHHARRTFSR
jgi:hypothetical protein